MSPLFMDTGCEPHSPGSLSAEECHSNTVQSEEGTADGQQVGGRGSKRREKNRDAARKSRKKQTERADELHEELQQLERSNVAFKKEIAALRKQLHEYETSLKRHEPHCRLGASLADSRSSSSPPKAPPKVSNSTLAPSLSTSLTTSLGLQTLPLTTTLASPAGSPAELFTSSSSSSCSSPAASFQAHSAPHSLFSDAAQITSIPTIPVYSSLMSKPPAKNTSAASFTVDAFLMKQPRFPTASPNVAPPYPHLEAENTGCAVNLPQLHPCRFNPNSSSPPAAAARSLSVSPPSLEPSSALPFTVSYNQQVLPSTASLLSLLTVPSPLNVPQTTSSSSDVSLSQPLPPDIGPDLSEFLADNDWILSGSTSTTE